MTVKMLIAWNGYPKDYIGSVISPSEEARLVSIGFASYDLDGVDNDNVRMPVTASKTLTGGIELTAGGASFSIGARQPILNNASAGADSGWLPISDAPERFAYQLDSGTTNTGFAVDISADGVSSLGQAFTGTWASSTVAEITFPIMFSNPLAKFFRWTVLSGGPLSVSRGV